MALNKEILNQLFLDARTHSKFHDHGVEDALLQRVYDLAKMGPTAANTCPMRILFIKSHSTKQMLKPVLDAGNLDKTMAAPVTAIIAMDMEFYEKLPTLFPHVDAKSWYAGKEAYIKETAFRGSTLQGAYFIIAARAMGLDCGPMSGFNNAKLDEIFFAGTSWKSNFLINLGYGDASVLHPRNPRPNFNEACKIL